MNKKMTVKIASAAAGLLVVVAASYFFGVRPQDTKLAQLKQKYDEDVETLVRLSARANDGPDAIDLRGNSEAIITSFKSRLLGNDRNQVVLAELNSICTETKVVLAVLEPEKAEKDNDSNFSSELFKKVNWNVAVSGTYQNLNAFMAKLENSRFFLGAENLAMMSADHGSTIESRFILYGYVLKNAKGESSGS